MLNFLRGNSNGGNLTGSELNIDGRTITIQDKIAQGGFGVIYNCVDSMGKRYALKALVSPDEEHYQSVLKEFKLHQSVADHPNVVTVYGMSTDARTRRAFILMDLCSGSCVNVMNERYTTGFDARLIFEIFDSACRAVSYCHSKSPPVIHRDLKVENILSGGGAWLLCDFGSATNKVYVLTDSSEINEAGDDISRNTTPQYRSPEMCDLYRRQRVDQKADVWAMGCVLFKLCTFKDAFGEGSNLSILNVKYQWPSERSVDPRFKEAVSFCLVPDPAQRPTIDEVIQKMNELFPEFAKEPAPISSDSSRRRRHHERPTETEPAPTPAPIRTPQPQISQGNDDDEGFELPSSFHVNIQQSIFQPKAPEPAPVQSLIEIDQFQSNPIQQFDLTIVDNNPELAVQKLLELPPLSLQPTLQTIGMTYSNQSPAVYFGLILRSGTRCLDILRDIPELSTSQLNSLVLHHRDFEEGYPEYEGNFSLHHFMVTHKTSPPPVGQAPICVDAAKRLLSVVDAAISAHRVAQIPQIQELAISAYTAAGFIISKLKMFKITLGYIDGTAIPLLKNLHGALQKTLSNAKCTLPFPSDPYNFDDPEFHRRIKLPRTKSN